MMLRILALLLLVVPARAGGFSTSARGTTAAQFLELGVDARAVSMGEAYSAVADDASALYWNPAGLARVAKRSATFMHAPYVDSSFFDYGAYAQRLGAAGALGASVQYFSAGSIDETDAAGADLGKFTPHDLAVTVGYAYAPGRSDGAAADGFCVGLAGKFIESKILKSARTGAADVGILSPYFLDRRLRLSATAMNLGGTIKFDQASENLPLTFRAGSAYKIIGHWLAALDVGFPRSDRPFVAVGTEAPLFENGPWRLMGQAGFNSRTIGSIDGFTGVSFGFGLGYSGYLVDYGFTPLGGVGQAHRVSLVYNF